MSAAGFSICVPVYNGGAFIERTITSVLAQSDPDWELLLVDDASTDDSLVRAARHPDARITVLTADENVGLARNWTRALAAASGDLCMLLGQDDALVPEAVARIKATFAAEPDAGMVAWSATVVDVEGPARVIARKHTGSVTPDDLFAFGLTLDDNPAPSQTAYRAEAVRAVGFYDPGFDYCPEIDLQCRLGAAGVSAVFLADTLSLRSNDPTRVTDRLRTTPVPLRDHYRLLARHAAAAPRPLVRRQRDALRRRATRLALHHLRHGRVRAAASFVKHVAIGERAVAAAT
jgi:glycosyltransferase involved in cell wall biosynthesis